MRAVILTALRVEYQAIKEHLTDLRPERHKGTIYEVGKFSADGKEWTVAITEIGQQNESASREAERAINHFEPQVAFFVGVAGGLKPNPKPNDAVIGDVIAATKVYGYESGKSESEFLPRPEVYRSSYELEQLARFVGKSDAWTKRIKSKASLSTPKAIVAPIAAGPKVLASTQSSIYKFIRSNYNDAHAVEMEGLGFLSAAHANKDIEAIVIRGISDLIDDKEGDDAKGSQDLASRHAAAFAFEILANLDFEDEDHTHKPLDPPENGKLPEPGDLPEGSRLPFHRNAVFTGRREDLMGLADALLYSNNGGVGITQIAAVTTGFGGMGKTQLAVEFCYRYGRFFQGVHWIQAEQDIMSEIAACGLVMGLPDWPAKINNQVALTLRSWQKGKPRLVVMDNVSDPSVVQEWMPRMPICKLLLTSREPKWPPDLGLKSWPLGILSRDKSKELLCKLSPRLKDASDDDLDDVADRLGDLPLALDLAGRYLENVTSLPPKNYLDALNKAGNALEHTSLKDWVGHNPTKHKTSLAGTFSLSWDQLIRDDVDCLARRVFRACGYCAPNTPIPVELLVNAFNPGDSNEMLYRAMGRLSSLGLIIPTDKGPSLHPLLAEFARLKDSGEKESVLPVIAIAMVGLAQNTRKTRLAERMIALWTHLFPVYKFAKTAGLKEAEILMDFLPKLDFSRPENSMYLALI